MTALTDHIMERELPHVSVRQWVLSLPYFLRYRLAYDNDLCTAVHRALASALLGRMRGLARERGERDAQVGSVAFVQRYGGELNLSVHYHQLAIDGWFRQSAGGLAFVHAPPSNESVDSARNGSKSGSTLDDEDDDERGSVTSQRDAGSDSATANVDAFERPFAALMHNSANWSTLAVTLKSARVQRGMPTDGVTLSATKTYVELELDVKNRTNADEELASRTTWDLILPDGSRISPLTTSALALTPQASVPLTLRYVVDPTFEPAGVVLELNGPTRGKLAPERIPRDSAYVPDSDVELTELKGRVLGPARENRNEERSIEIIEARVSRNSLIEGRAEFGKMFVELLVDITAVKTSYGINIFEHDFAIRIDGKRALPINLVNEIGSAGETVRAPIVFAIDDATRTAVVTTTVGYDGNLDPKVETASAEIHF